MFYKAAKGGKDTFDRLCSSATCSRKTHRWPLSFLYGIINLTITNSHIIHQHKEGGQAISKWNFTTNLVEDLCVPWACKSLQTPTLSRELRCLIMIAFSLSGNQQAEEPYAKGERRKRLCYLSLSTSVEHQDPHCVCWVSSAHQRHPPQPCVSSLLPVKGRVSTNFFLVGNGLLYNHGQFSNFQ